LREVSEAIVGKFECKGMRVFSEGQRGQGAWEVMEAIQKLMRGEEAFGFFA
jgi:hypothetical protein